VAIKTITVLADSVRLPSLYSISLCIKLPRPSHRISHPSTTPRPQAAPAEGNFRRRSATATATPLSIPPSIEWLRPLFYYHYFYLAILMSLSYKQSISQPEVTYEKHPAFSSVRSRQSFHQVRPVSCTCFSISLLIFSEAACSRQVTTDRNFIRISVYIYFNFRIQIRTWQYSFSKACFHILLSVRIV
jgi:hypothetical protein